MNTRKTNRLAKVAEKDAKKAIRNARKRELRALQKADSATTKVENLQAQIAELNTTIETKWRDAAREVEVVAKRLSKTKLSSDCP